MMNSVMVRVEGLSVRRGSSAVLADLDLELRAGELTGLLGPSGSGKTTLMRSLVGVQRTEGGSVTVFGEVAGSKAARGQVGYVTQAASVYDDLTVAQNLRYFAKVLGALPDQAARLIEEVDLVGFRDVVVSRLSGGQRSRVSLAIALLASPKLLVLDEPTVGLDPLLRRDLWELFRRLADDGLAILVSSHVMDEAVRCDRLLLMRAGRILADASLPALLERTGAPSVEEAFIALVEASAGVAA